MVTNNFRKLRDYDSNKEDWQSYAEHLELFFTANNVADVQKKRAILLTSCGIETYRLLKGLTAPAKPVEKTFDELVNLMTNHENTERNPIAERFQFNMRYRKTGESVSQYIHGRTKKTQSTLRVWQFFRFYVQRLFSVWDKP